MKRFETVYTWNVIDTISDGVSVRMIDKELNEVYFAENMNALSLIRAINYAKEHSDGRFEFYREVYVDEQ